MAKKDRQKLRKDAVGTVNEFASVSEQLRKQYSPLV